MNLRSIFTRVIGYFRSHKAAASRPEERRTSLKVEQLEQREVLSGFGGGWNVPSTFHWRLGHLPGETRVLAGTALANSGLGRPRLRTRSSTSRGSSRTCSRAIRWAGRSPG